MGPSLNDSICKSPCEPQFLFEVSGIETVYLQISIANWHGDILRFLSFGDIFEYIPEVVQFPFRRVIFGANCFVKQLFAIMHLFGHALKFCRKWPKGFI